MLITVDIFNKEDKSKNSIKCQKVLTKDVYQKTKEKLPKEGSMIYPAKIFNKDIVGNNEIIFISKNQEIVKEIKDAKYVIETKKIKKLIAPQIPENIIKKEEIISLLPLVEEPPKIEEKKQPDLTVLFEEKKAKIEETIKAEEKAKVDSEIEKLRMDLLRAKVSLINEWIRANKE